MTDGDYMCCCEYEPPSLRCVRCTKSGDHDDCAYLMRIKPKKKDKTQEGLKEKYHVSRTDGKPVGACIVLEFDDPLTHPALLQWADTMEDWHYVNVAKDVRNKIKEAKSRYENAD